MYKHTGLLYEIKKVCDNESSQGDNESSQEFHDSTVSNHT